jgi:hypothetical protein
MFRKKCYLIFFLKNIGSGGQTFHLSDFSETKFLGSGKFGRVVEARHRASGAFVALKAVPKSDVDSSTAAEIRIQSSLVSIL